MLYYSRTKINDPRKGKLIKINKTKTNNSGEIEETFKGIMEFIKKDLTYYLGINKCAFIYTLSEREKIEALLSSKSINKKLKEKINIYYNL